jgi:hypothetical protein
MVSAQLSLFDTAAVIHPIYKVGDRVRVKRKTPHAPLLKKGDIVQIEAIHPHNGSCKFWNELTESWGYLYPDELVLLPPADNNDSVSEGKAQIADTKYTVPPADNNDSVSKAISTYHPRGTARSGEYFRFSYRDGSRMKHIHIRGGNTDSPIAQAKVAEVRSLLAAGMAPAEIAAMLKTPKL